MDSLAQDGTAQHSTRPHSTARCDSRGGDRHAGQTELLLHGLVLHLARQRATHSVCITLQYAGSAWTAPWVRAPSGPSRHPLPLQTDVATVPRFLPNRQAHSPYAQVPPLQGRPPAPIHSCAEAPPSPLQPGSMWYATTRSSRPLRSLN
jgi:hypothetical protein